LVAFNGGKKCFRETGMNRYGSQKTMKIVLYTMDSRLRASLEARRAGSFFQFLSLIRRGGVPSGAAAIIVSDGQSGNNPRIIVE
jgi:hypothetical protein